MRLFDTLQNLVANLGGGTSKSTHDRFVAPTLADTQLEAMYRGDWISRKIVDLPVRDMLRAWREWQAENADIEAIEEAEKRHEVKAKIGLALVLARLYGGSAIVIGADVATPMAPLNLRRIGRGGLQYLTVLPKRVIHVSEIERDPASPYFGQPKSYLVGSSIGGQVEIHPSRVIPFVGMRRPDIDVNPDGWGDSVLSVVYDAIHAAALTSTGIAELVHDSKVDVISIPNLGATLSTDQGTQAITRRFSAANALKSINNVLLLDDTEKWDRKQTSFTGLPDVLASFMQIVSGAADIPVTRLLGTAPKGLNATGDGDLRNYYDMLDGMRHDVLCPVLDRIDAVLWADALGKPKPKDAFWSFSSLWQMSETEKADLAKKYAETAKIYADMNIMPEEALAQGVVNQLVESEIYPGLEAAISEWVAAGRSLVPEEPDPDALQSAGNGSERLPATLDHTSPYRRIARPRTGLDRDIDELREVYSRLGAGEYH